MIKAHGLEQQKMAVTRRFKVMMNDGLKRMARMGFLGHIHISKSRRNS